MAQKRVIDVVESAYRLDLDDAEWAEALARHARPLVDRGLGAFVWLYRMNGLVPVGPPALAGADAWVQDVLELGMAQADPRVVDDALLSAEPQRGVASTSERYAPNGLDHMAGLSTFARRHGFRDFFGVRCAAPSGLACLVGGFSPTLLRTTHTQRLRWERLSGHLNAALRLRERGAHEREDAVVAPNGDVVHASPSAHGSRGRLREHVLAIERSRRQRSRGDEALALWRVLADGCWTLVDRFERGDRRYLVAYRNEIGARDSLGLTKREAAVGALLAAGASNKLIAYELGISEGNVAAVVATLRRKLRASSRVELVALLGEPVARIETRLGESGLYALCSENERTVGQDGDHAALSKAEREVVAHAARGLSNADIARARSCSVRTVTTLLASAYRRLGVKSRTELVARARPHRP